MKKILLSLLLIAFVFTVKAQKYVSVVESFCNTGKYDSRFSIQDLHDKSVVDDTSDLNHIYIQYHVDYASGAWNDNYVMQSNSQKWAQYEANGIVDSLSGVAKNGVHSTSTNWYNCDPEEIEIYSAGAKKVSLLFDSYNGSDSTLVVRFVLAKKYLITDNKSIQIFLLENNINLNITAGENAGQNFVMNNVARAFRIKPATVYSDTVTIKIPSGTTISNAHIVAFVQDNNTFEILGGTRGFPVNRYITAPGNKFAVVEVFTNTGCFGSPSAISSMFNYAANADSNNLNDAMVQLHIYQTYGNWSDVYTLQLNNERYDNYSWNKGILAGLSAVSKNGIRYTPDVWNDCSPVEKTATAFIDLQLAAMDSANLVLNYTLSGVLDPHDRVYFYLIESGITVDVTGAEIPGTTHHMNNVARFARVKTTSDLSDSVLLKIPSDALIENTRVLAYIQNDVTYEVTGCNKGFKPNTVSVGYTAKRKSDFSIYPNPSSGDINILLGEFKNQNDLLLTITDAAGKECYSRQLKNAPSLLSISGLKLSPGIYFLSLISQENVVVKKLEIF